MSFEVGADAYDRFMGRYSAPLAPAFADFAAVAGAMRVLDVGCGPGPTFEDWWEPFTFGVGPAGAYVAGLDVIRQGELRERCRDTGCRRHRSR